MIFSIEMTMIQGNGDKKRRYPDNKTNSRDRQVVEELIPWSNECILYIPHSDHIE